MISPLKRFLFLRDEHDIDFALGPFIVLVVLQSVGWFAGSYFLWQWLRPDILQAQIASAWWTYPIWFTATHMVCGLFEYLFHRYVLHSEFWRALGSMKRSHTEHHSLTHVRELAHTADDSGKAEVRNKYPILSPEQIHASTFPVYALVSFFLLFSVLLIPLQLLMPAQPLLIMGYLAVVSSYSLYEVKHAIEHMDYEKHWKKHVERSRFIRQWYGFHLMHHARIRVNQAIGGVFALPIWDWVFGTYFVPKDLPLPGVRITPTSWTVPKPRWPISWLDSLVARCEARIVKKRKEKALARRAELKES